VLLQPNPILTPVPKDAVITEYKAGVRRFRSNRDVGQGKQVTQLVLKADPTKGPFNCDFKLGEFELKLLSVRVESKVGDTRVSARVSHPSSNHQRDVYFRVVDVEEGRTENRNRFLELRSKKDEETKNDDPIDAYFVAIDSISLDVTTGLWTKIVLSLINVAIPRVPSSERPQNNTNNSNKNDSNKQQQPPQQAQQASNKQQQSTTKSGPKTSK
jgi:hypothetical protein